MKCDYKVNSIGPTNYGVDTNYGRLYATEVPPSVTLSTTIQPQPVFNLNGNVVSEVAKQKVYLETLSKSIDELEQKLDSILIKKVRVESTSTDQPKNFNRSNIRTQIDDNNSSIVDSNKRIQRLIESLDI